MDPIDHINSILSEHRFWLQIMGDHARFIFFSLAPSESEYIIKAQEFITLFDQLLEDSHRQLKPNEVEDLNKRAYEITYRFWEYKVDLLSLSLTFKINSHLSPSFLNEALNELEEYLFILNSFISTQTLLLHPLHHHLLWLPCTSGHASFIVSALDFGERDLIEKASHFEIELQNLNTKATLLHGFLRTGLDTFPALDRLNVQTEITVNNFKEFLSSIRDQRQDSKILGTLLPLMADHMYRESCYYLQKLFTSIQSNKRSDCDPSSPRSAT